jgi:hypothetical protein
MNIFGAIRQGDELRKFSVNECLERETQKLLDDNPSDAEEVTPRHDNCSGSRP